MKKEALFDYVGNDTDWLAFWGAYLGGCFTVLLGLYNIRQENKRQAKLIRHEARITTLQLEIENCKTQRQEIINHINNDLQFVNSLRLAIIVHSYTERSKGEVRETIENLTHYLLECTNRKNNYGLSKQKEPIFDDYDQQMKICIEKHIDITNELLSIMHTGSNSQQRKEEIGGINYVEQINAETTKLTKKASEVIEYITNKIFNKEKELLDLQLKKDL